MLAYRIFARDKIISKNMSVEKLDLQSPDLVNENFEKLANLFPNCVTESAEGKAIDFDLLKQELSHAVIEGNRERYRLEWPGKREAIVTANLPTTKTLRPVREDSVDFDNTENIYIEGDNLEVLKVLQESYFGKIKMIYIDPPYNTGKDFVYKDNFTGDKEAELFESGQVDEYNQRLVANPDGSGRYHSDWLTMMYPRLKLARNLLTDDGVIFISIDDNEVHNLRKICDDVFGERNFIGNISWLKKRKGSFLTRKIISLTEYCLVYGKTSDVKLFGGMPDSTESQPLIKRTNSINTLSFPHNSVKTKLKDGEYKKGTYGEGSSAVKLKNDIHIRNGVIESEFNLEGPFIWSQENLSRELKNGAQLIINTINFQIRAFKSENPESFKGFPSFINGVEIGGTNEDGYEQLRDLLQGEKLLDYPKPINYLQKLILSQTYFDKDSIVLDFFSGSATTAHAVMQLNADDEGNRKYIMVQLPELTDEKSEAHKEGYKNICEIGKERIRRAAKQIQEEKWIKVQKEAEKEGLVVDYSDTQDYGFRVYRLDSSNMQDVYYRPQDYKQDTMDMFADNIKTDRSADDLLTQVMLDWGLPLSYKIEQLEVKGKQVFNVADNSLIACFDKGINEDFAKEIATYSPLRIVFRDSGFADDTAKINVQQLLKQLSPETEMKVI